MEKKLKDLVDKALSRRSFLAGAGSVAAGTLIAGCSDSTPATTTPVATTTAAPAALTDADYLNFALNLEYLEAEFYLHAATGTGLSTTDAGSGAGSVTVPAVTQLTGLTAVQSAYLNEVAQNELDHVRLLRSALAGAAVPRPAIDLTFFGTLAMVAGITKDTSFTPFASYPTYLIGAFIFEDVGVTAYHGAALVLTSKANLTVGAEIHAVEAYHAASIRTQIVAADFLANTGTNTYTNIANQVSTLRGTLGGGAETMLSQTTIVASDSNSIGYKRSPDQVLHIVYGAAGGAGVSKGGFFPAGLNGKISVTAS
ncbi:ferritin-like domain-containing protein [Granulicella arctica]|uniref:ferritin-like domain-containing protein n=1 Tax=Granulicella arctica TaxID=940613 RepID=UPI0021DFC0CA|nr:ferritin-like domain-containing protein [Granulicella arctica]